MYNTLILLVKIQHMQKQQQIHRLFININQFFFYSTYLTLHAQQKITVSKCPQQNTEKAKRQLLFSPFFQIIWQLTISQLIFMIPFVMINIPSPPTEIVNFDSHACLPIDPDRKCLNHFLILLMISVTLSKSLIFRIPIADYVGSNLISTKIDK